MTLKLRSLALGTILLVSGCATTSQPSVVTVNVPVPVPCNIVPPTVPFWPLQGDTSIDEDIYSLVQKALAEIELRKGYETELEGAISGCNSK